MLFMLANHRCGHDLLGKPLFVLYCYSRLCLFVLNSKLLANDQQTSSLEFKTPGTRKPD